MSHGKPHSKSLTGFQSLFDTLYPNLCLFANSYLKDLDTSKDLVQEVFIGLWQKQKAFDSTQAAKPYLYTAVKNKCLNHLKSKHYKIQLEAIRADFEVMDTEDYFQAQLLAVETYAQLHQAIASLPDKTAKVMQLAMNNYSNTEIAEELAVTTSTVRTQKSMAYQKLKGLLSHLNQLFLNF